MNEKITDLEWDVSAVLSREWEKQRVWTVRRPCVWVLVQQRKQNEPRLTPILQYQEPSIFDSNRKRRSQWGLSESL